MAIDVKPDVSVWNQLQAVVNEVPGWTPIEELFALYNLALASASLEGDVLEIGSWCGRSTVALAMACKQTPGRRVVACDLFPARDDWRRNEDGSYSFSVQIDGVEFGAYESQTVWKEPFERDIAPLYEQHDGILEIFKASLARFDCGDLVDVIRGDSDILKARLAPERRFGLVFLDGDHGYASVAQDIRNTEAYVAPGCWMAFDDAFTCYQGVDEAISEFVAHRSPSLLQVQLTRKMFAVRLD